MDPNCSISAEVEGTHDHGIVQGLGNFERGKQRIKMKYLPRDSSVAVNQFVYTSGLGPYFPAGLCLGTVDEVPPLKNDSPIFGLYREAIIKPIDDLDQLDELFIVLGPKESPSSDKTPPSGGTTPP